MADFDKIADAQNPDPRDRAESRRTLERLNAVYAGESTVSDTLALAAMKELQRALVDGEW